MQIADNGSESEWIKRAKRGDEDAFAYLVEAYKVPVYNLCYRMLNDIVEAEDAAQEAFLKAYRGMGRYDPERSFATWLLSIASHHCIDRIRRRRIFTLSFDDLLPSQEKPDTTPDPETSLTMREHQDDVRELLQHLRTRDRAAVVLRYWYDMSYEEIAQALSLTVSAVKSRLHRARREMADRWMEHEITTFTVKGRRDEASAI
jgi:RNA polymerase sigma-70 factor (ECF subfamily)